MDLLIKLTIFQHLIRFWLIFSDLHFKFLGFLSQIIKKVKKCPNLSSFWSRCVIYAQLSFIWDQSQVSSSTRLKMAGSKSQLPPSTAMKKMIFHPKSPLLWCFVDPQLPNTQSCGFVGQKVQTKIFMDLFSENDLSP